MTTTDVISPDLKTVLPTRQRPKGSVETFQSKLTTQRATEPVTITTEDYGAVLLGFDNGARGSFTVSQVTAGRKNCLRFEIAGSKGAVAWDSERPNELWLGHRDRPNELLVRDPALLSPSVRPFANYPGGHNEAYPDGPKNLFRNVYGFIAGERKGATSPRSRTATTKSPSARRFSKARASGNGSTCRTDGMAFASAVARQKNR